MRFFVLFFILLVAVHTVSYAKYNWNQENRLAALGLVILTGVSISLPVVLFFLR